MSASMNCGSPPSCSGSGGCRAGAASGKVFAEYVWIGGTGSDLHSKTKVLSSQPRCIGDLPVWHFDGLAGSPGLAYLQPRTYVPDPFRGGEHVLVLCDTFCPPRCHNEDLATRVHPTNNRFPCCAVMEAASRSDPIFSVEQQYTLLKSDSLWPLGWPERASGDLNRSFNCGVGQGSVVGRDFAEAHLTACCSSGLSLSGVKADTAPGQWSFTVGPCRGVELGDQLWLSRYILLRLTERHNLVASLDPKPVPGDWSGSGAPVKYSTAETRDSTKGLTAIDSHIRVLQQAHLHHIMVYGPGNAKRLTGLHKTSSVMLFTAGIEDRGASIRVPQSTVMRRCGHYEDRRPASNMDPYLVTMMLVCTTLGIPLPLGAEHSDMQDEQDESSSEVASRGSSALIDEIDRSIPMGPSTPDGMPGPSPQNATLTTTASPADCCCMALCTDLLSWVQLAARTHTAALSRSALGRIHDQSNM